jgi:hypothetical protein
MFVPSPTDLEAYAFINGIEIVLMPPYLYYTPVEEEKGFEFISQPNNLAHIENNSAIEMLYQINVGGADISPAKDTVCSGCG